MKITFPNLGNSIFPAKAIFDGLGIEYVLPTPSNNEALEIGSFHSPEEICLPYKIMLGNYIQSIERGADTVIITGSCGPCRYGEYCEMQMNLIKNLGHSLDFIVIDKPSAIGKKEFMARITKLVSTSQKSKAKKIRVVLNAYKIVKLIDEIEMKARYKVGFEINKGQCKDILKQCKSEALNCKSDIEMVEHLKNYQKIINKVQINPKKNPIKVAILGEIYTVLEPFSNLYIEDKLMDYGVSTYRGLTTSWWVKDAVLSPLKLNSIKIRRASKKYLPLYIGGHARECIGEAVLAEKKGFDGAIQVYPVGCMPEIVSHAILPTISKDKNFPIMTLILDEMTGEAGFVTRIEAFLDLIERRNEDVLLGN
ncbi:MAG: 2-hydroxyglutaryl-CoA dehydratase [Clostridiaceae bacterium]|nr:2-hydroxyglutaryl-CoA dehydratase [Clostridiaceae bacterium]